MRDSVFDDTDCDYMKHHRAAVEEVDPFKKKETRSSLMNLKSMAKKSVRWLRRWIRGYDGGTTKD